MPIPFNSNMVSKIKKPSFKRATRQNTRRKTSPLKKSPAKKTPLKHVITAASSVFLTSVNKSIYNCKRRLLAVFTGIVNSGSPTHRRNGFQLLPKTHQDCEFIHQPIHQKIPPITRWNPLPPPTFPKTVFLDLDETLIHSKIEPPPPKYDFVVRPVIDGEIMVFYVLKRPGVDELLERIGKEFEIVVFTAGLKEYASLVIDQLDPRGLISHRLYRDSCKEVGGKFLKDLSEFGRDMKTAIIVDDNPNAYSLQPDNAVPIQPFVDDLGDQELRRLAEFFEIAAGFEDLRDAVKLYFPR